MNRSRHFKHSPRRAFALITVLFVMGIMLIVAVLLLNDANSLVGNTQMLQQKNQIFNAAEAGLDSGVDLLDRNNAATVSTSCPGSTLQGYVFTCGIAENNFTGTTGAAIADPVNGNSVTVPKGDALIWGKSQSVLGGRSVWAEALVRNPLQSLQFPPGAINSNHDVNGGGHMPVDADLTDTVSNDASVHANNNVTSFTTTVQGPTYAVGTDSQPGWDGSIHSGATAVTLPSSSFVTNFASYTYSQAFSGAKVSPASVGANTTYIYTGNTYFGNSTGTTGSGNLDLTQGTYVFNGGIVFVDGYLCLSGKAQIINNGNTTFVVRNQFSQVGNSTSYKIGAGTAGVLAVLGTNTAPSCSAANGPYAANISGNGTEDIGVLYTPNGSVELAGNGQVTGAIETGTDAVLSGGGSGGTFHYDHNLVVAQISAPQNVKILSYGEFSK